MKKVFLFALAALSLVACKKETSEDPASVTITLSESSVTLKVNETKQLTATVTPAETALTWSSDAPTVASVSATGLVVAIAEGSTYIRVKAGSVEKYCMVTVSNSGGGDTPSGPAGKLVECVKIWPVILDQTTSEANASKIAGDFRPDDVNRHLYIWPNGETYAANNNPTGKNFFQTESNGGYLAMTVAGGQGWAGMGYFIAKEDIAGVNALIEAMKKNPSNYGFHMAFKSTDNYSHYFAILGQGDAGMKWAIGNNMEAPKKFDAPRTGAWYVVNVNMADYAAILAGVTTSTADGMNVFYMGSEGVDGAQMNLDACYFYQIANE